RGAEVTPGHQVTADPQLAELTGGQVGTAVVDDPDGRAHHRPADRDRPVRAGRDRVQRRPDRRLRGAVRVPQDRAAVEELPGEYRWKQLAAAHHRGRPSPPDLGQQPQLRRGGLYQADAAPGHAVGHPYRILPFRVADQFDPGPDGER